jgi:hypothetical protein
MDHRTRLEATETIVYELQRTGIGKLTMPGEVKSLKQAEPQIIPLTGPSEIGAADFCAQRIICRLANKLGCRFCVTK